MSFNHKDLVERYRNDGEFAMLVNAIHSMIATAGFTPSEIREAAFLAHYNYEMENPHVILKRFEDNTLTFIRQRTPPWRMPDEPA